MKKLISVIIICAMLFAAAPTGFVFADEVVAVAVDTAIAAPGDTGVELFVRMSAEPHWASVALTFTFDADALIYKGFRRNPALEAQAESGETFIYVVNSDSAGEGVVSVQFATAGNAGGYFGYFPDGCDYFGVLTFDVAPSAAVGIAEVSAEVTTLTNFESQSVLFTQSAGGVSVIACEHDWVVTAQAEMDCENAGFTDRECSKCHTTKHEVIPARGHLWNEIERVEPSVDAEGSVVYECVWCGVTRTEILSVLPPYDGVRVRVEKVAANPGTRNVEVKLYVADTPRWGSIDVSLYFDPAVLTFKSFLLNPELQEQSDNGEPNIYTLNKTAAASGEVKVLFASAYEADGYDGYHSGGYDYFGTAKFNVADDAPIGFSDIAAAVNKLTTNENVELTREVVDGGVKITCVHAWDEAEREELCVGTGHVVYQCSKCGEYKREELPAVGHSWGEWAETTSATCTADAVETRVCSRCGETETRKGKGALGHNFGEWAVTTAPTCTEKGEETRYCTRCDAFETREVKALGHNYAAVVTAPTCTEGGYTTYTCSGCGDSYVVEGEAASGHVWGEWTVTTPRTFYSVGEETRVCANDPTHVETREIPVYLKGDIDEDGEITVSDALRVLRIAADLIEETPKALAIADTDRDGEITVADALQVLRCAARIISMETWLG